MDRKIYKYVYGNIYESMVQKFKKMYINYTIFRLRNNDIKSNIKLILDSSKSLCSIRYIITSTSYIKIK